MTGRPASSWRQPASVLIAALGLLFAAELLEAARHFLPTVLTGGHVGRMTAFGDLDYYLDAARRFLHDPATLYDRASMMAFMGYIYPPIGILFFVPFALAGSAAGFLGFAGLSVLAGLAAAVLLGRLALRGRALVVFVLLVAASGPFFANLVAVQFNLLVLCACALAVAAGARGWPWLGGLALALACWMKIYPGVLLIAMLALPVYRPVALRGIVVGFALPLLLLWLIPSVVYLDFLNGARSLSGQFLSGLDNGSLVAVLERARLPFADWGVYRIMPMDRRTGLATLAIGTALLGLLLWRGWSGRGRAGSDVPVLLGALAVIPLLTPQGWGHAFVFAMPLVAALLLTRRHPVVRGLAALAWLALLVPSYHVFGALVQAPWPVAYLVYGRYTLAVLVLVLAALLSPPAPAQPALG